MLGMLRNGQERLMAKTANQVCVVDQGQRGLSLDVWCIGPHGEPRVLGHLAGPNSESN